MYFKFHEVSILFKDPISLERMDPWLTILQAAKLTNFPVLKFESESLWLRRNILIFVCLPVPTGSYHFKVSYLNPTL